MYLGAWPKSCGNGNHPIEIEDLIPLNAAAEISKRLGEDAHDATQKCRGKTHYSYSKAWKELAITQLPNELGNKDLRDFVWLGEEIETRVIKISEQQGLQP
ncbi:hypothetical protein FIV07_04180 [Mycobacterium sp. THAF192]|nr:hypothetical protein FIV07_04180 [Mycobacterium sp. THAF192]